MIRRLKECRSFKDLYNVIPESFYEKTSLGLLLALVLMIILETLRRCLMLYGNILIHSSYVWDNYFYYLGYVMIAFALFVTIVKLSGIGIKTYFKDNPYDILLLMLLFIGFIATLNAESPMLAFMGHMGRRSGFRTYLIYAAAYICGKNVCGKGKINSISSKYKFYTYLMICCTVQNFLLILRIFNRKGFLGGAFMNTNHSAYFMVICIFAIMAVASFARDIKMKVLSMFVYIINIYCMIINNTFGSYAAVVLGMIFIFIISFIKKRKPDKKIIVYIALFAAVSIIADWRTHIISDNINMTGNDVKNISDKNEEADDAGNGRWWIWKDALQCIKAYPLLGCGPDCMSTVKKSYISENISEEEDYNLITCHNEYLQYGCEIGIPGMMCYIAAIAVMFVMRMRNIREYDDSVVYDGTVVFAYCVSAFFGVIMFYTAVFYFTFLGIVSNDNRKVSHPSI